MRVGCDYRVCVLILLSFYCVFACGIVFRTICGVKSHLRVRICALAIEFATLRYNPLPHVRICELTLELAILGYNSRPRDIIFNFALQPVTSRYNLRPRVTFYTLILMYALVLQFVPLRYNLRIYFLPLRTLCIALLFDYFVWHFIKHIYAIRQNSFLNKIG